MKMFSRLAMGALALAMIAGAAGPVQAACPGAPALLTITADSASYIYTEGWPSSGASCYTFGCYESPIAALKGDFWALANGGAANNGTFPVGDWLDLNGLSSIGYYYLPGALMNTNWNQSGAINGCVFDPVVGPNGECTCVLLTDEQGGVGYSALFEGRIDATGTTSLAQPGNAPIVLRSIPSPRVVSSVRNAGTFNIDSLVVSVAASTGVYGKDSCNCDSTSKYLVRGMVLPRGTPAPDTRDIAAWPPMNLAGGGTQTPSDAGTNVDLESMCGMSDTDLWLAAEVIYDSGVNTTVVSTNGTKLECGPNLAEPINRRPTRVDRPANQRRDRVQQEGGR